MRGPRQVISSWTMESPEWPDLRGRDNGHIHLLRRSGRDPRVRHWDICDIDHHEIHADFADHRGFLSTDDHSAFAAIVAMQAIKIADRQDGDFLLVAFDAIASSIADRFSLLAVH